VAERYAHIAAKPRPAVTIDVVHRNRTTLGLGFGGHKVSRVSTKRELPEPKIRDAPLEAHIKTLNLPACEIDVVGDD
jgi:hypothetical protein